VMFTGITITTAILHLMGAGIGFGVGIAMLKLDWVDCENWDFFSVRAGRNTMDSEELAQWREGLQSHQEIDRSDEFLQQIKQTIADGQPQVAFAVHQKMLHTHDTWTLPENDLLNLIVAFHKQQLWSESLPPMVEYLQSYSSAATQVRLKLAQILIGNERRPAQALKVLAKLSVDTLNEKQRRTYQQLKDAAEELRAESDFEVADDDW